jgi:hypothetical protein
MFWPWHIWHCQKFVFLSQEHSTLASLNFQSPLCLISTQNRNGIMEPDTCSEHDWDTIFLQEIACLIWLNLSRFLFWFCQGSIRNCFHHLDRVTGRCCWPLFRISRPCSIALQWTWSCGTLPNGCSTHRWQFLCASLGMDLKCSYSSLPMLLLRVCELFSWVNMSKVT